MSDRPGHGVWREIARVRAKKITVGCLRAARGRFGARVRSGRSSIGRMGDTNGPTVRPRGNARAVGRPRYRTRARDARRGDGARRRTRARGRWSEWFRSRRIHPRARARTRRASERARDRTIGRSSEASRSIVRMSAWCARSEDGKRAREGDRERNEEEEKRSTMYRSPSVDGEDGMMRERAHSFSTERSDRTTAFADGFVDAADERGRALCSLAEEMWMEEFPSARAIATLAGKVTSMTDPDGAELHADVALGLLKRERETHGTFVFDERRAHHAPYRARLVEWILDVCAGERYGPTTADVAIAYMVRSMRSMLDSRRGGWGAPGWAARARRASIAVACVGCCRSRMMDETGILSIRLGWRSERASANERLT